MSCTICIDDISKNDIKGYVRLECQHEFHFKCFMTWEKQSCPLCRRQYDYCKIQEYMNCISDLHDEIEDKDDEILNLEEENEDLLFLIQKLINENENQLEESTIQKLIILFLYMCILFYF
jgi:hypothetical protein